MCCNFFSKPFSFNPGPVLPPRADGSPLTNYFVDLRGSCSFAPGTIRLTTFTKLKNSTESGPDSPPLT